MEITQTRARARIQGAGDWAAVSGLATFRQCRRGVLVTVEVQGLPQKEEPEPWLGVGIQPRWPAKDQAGPVPAPETVTKETVPDPSPGDLPPLLGCEGVAFASFLTGRFRVEQIIGQRLLICTRWGETLRESGTKKGHTIAWGEIVAGC